MIELELSMQGVPQLESAFLQMERMFEDFTPVFEKIGDEFLPTVRQKFEQGGPGWQRLSTEYAVRKQNLFGHATPMRATDRLYDSFKKKASDGISRIDKLEAEFGSSVPYGIYHQEGRGRNPVRMIIDVTNEQEAQFTRVAVNVLNHQIKDMGFLIA